MLVSRKLAVLVAVAFVSACQHTEPFRHTRANTPLPTATVALMDKKKMTAHAPILMRAYKMESELEVWKKAESGRYELLKTFPMCRWSGQLGPKIREGDRQAPEGFYKVTQAPMNPNSSLFLSFNLGFPNEFDRAHGRTGSHLMVHGSCTSSGCFAITDAAMAEVYALARDAFAGGQAYFQFQSFPFRMTPENLARHRGDPNISFWRDLKVGSDLFEVSGQESRWSLREQRYDFSAHIPEAVTPLLAKRRSEHESKIAKLITEGAPAVRLVYADGGGHASFRNVLRAGLPARESGSISRPEALLHEPREEAFPARP